MNTEHDHTEQHSRREALGTIGALAVGAGLLSLGAQPAQAQTSVVSDALNLILTVKYFQRALYNQKATSAIKDNEAAIFGKIKDQEDLAIAHIESVLTPKIIAQPETDFAKNYPNVFSDFQQFLIVAQALEDLSQRCIKGLIDRVMVNTAIVDLVMQIQSVDARHAAAIRYLRGTSMWVRGAGNDGGITDIYRGEDAVGLGGAPASAADAFDEELGPDEVLSLLDKFRA